MLVLQSAIAIQMQCPQDRVVIAMAFQGLCSSLASAVALQIGTTLFKSKLVSELSATPGLDVQAIVDAGATGFQGMGLSLEELHIVRGNYNLAVRDAFYLALGLVAITFFASWGLGNTTAVGRNIGNILQRLQKRKHFAR